MIREIEEIFGVIICKEIAFKTITIMYKNGWTISFYEDSIYIAYNFTTYNVALQAKTLAALKVKIDLL